MQATGKSEWRRPGTVIAIVALILSGSTAGVVIWEALQSQPLLHSTPVTKTILVSKGRITLVGNGTVAYVNFTVPNLPLVSATLNVSFTGTLANSTTRVSLLSQAQYVKFKTCNCIFYGNYSGVSTQWSSPLSNQYTAQVPIPYSANWIFAFQHAPGNGTAENFDETLLLTYTTTG